MVSPSRIDRIRAGLNYVLVNRRFKSSDLDTRVFRETYLQSDHLLVVSRVRLKLTEGITARTRIPDRQEATEKYTMCRSLQEWFGVWHNR